MKHRDLKHLSHLYIEVLVVEIGSKEILKQWS